MRAIRKGNEPASLTRHRSNPDATYDNYQDKDALRQCLVSEQRGLCCYCLSRIRPNRDEMKVEHWRCQAEFPGEQLAYSNLLASCKGHEGSVPRDQHCDTLKGDRVLSRNPAILEHRVEDFIRYRPDGTIHSKDPILDEELSRVLNLNCDLLKNNRKAVLEGFIEALPRRVAWPTGTCERHLRAWNGESDSGDLKEYCQIVVYWLRKRLNRS